MSFSLTWFEFVAGGADAAVCDAEAAEGGWEGAALCADAELIAATVIQKAPFIIQPTRPDTFIIRVTSLVRLTLVNRTTRGSLN